MPRKRGRPPKLGIDRREAQYAPITDLLDCEKAFYEEIMRRIFSPGGHYLFDLFNSKNLDITARSKWRNNSIDGPNPKVFAQCYISGLSLNAEQVCPLGPDNDQKRNLKAWWESEDAKTLKNSLTTLLSDYISSIDEDAKLQAAAHTAEIAKTAAAAAKKVPKPPTKLTSFADLTNVPTLPKGWKRIVGDDFLKPNDSDTQSKGCEYLRGNQDIPYWIARHVAVPRPAEVESLKNEALSNTLTFVSGPVGHGKSTLVRQLADAWIADGRDVIHVLYQSAFDNDAFRAECMKSNHPLLVIDGWRPDKPIPEWTLPDGIGGGPRVSIVITVQSREVAELRDFVRHLKPRNWRMPNVHADRATEYVDRFEEYGALLHSDRQLAVERFKAGLVDEDGNGGLWSAAYEATRGVELDKRINEIVENFRENDDDGRFMALAGVAFLNTVLEYGNEFPEYLRFDTAARKSLIARTLRSHDDISDDHAAKACSTLDRFGSVLEREFLDRSRSGIDLDKQADPVLEFRSPALVHAFNRWIFGSRSNRNDPGLLSRWNWYVALARALSDEKASGPSHVAVMQSMLSACFADIRHKTLHNRLREIDIERLAKSIDDLARSNGHIAPPISDRLNIRLAIASMLQASHAASVEAAEKSRSFGCARIRASIGEGAHSDVLFGAFRLLADNKLDLGLDLQGRRIDTSGMADRILTDLRASKLDKRKVRLELFNLNLGEPPVALGHLDDHVTSMLPQGDKYPATMRRFCDGLAAWSTGSVEQRQWFAKYLDRKFETDSINGFTSLAGFIVSQVCTRQSWLAYMLQRSASENTWNDPIVVAYDNMLKFVCSHPDQLVRDFGPEAGILARTTLEQLQAGDRSVIGNAIEKFYSIMQSTRAIELAEV